MRLRGEHFDEADRDLVVLAGQRLLTWGQRLLLDESADQSWYRAVHDDPVGAVNRLAGQIDDADSALWQARGLLDQALQGPGARAARQGPRR